MIKDLFMNSGYFGINGLLGLLIAVILLLSIAVFLGYLAVNIQKNEATNYYSIDDANVKMIDTLNKDNYRLNGVQ